VVCQVCPARVILPLFSAKMPTFPTFKTVLTSIFSSLSLLFLFIYICGLFITRAWCRICPNGTLTGFFNRGALIVKRKESRKCTKCGICRRVCPFGNEHVYSEKKLKTLQNPECIMCLTCIEKCPEQDCLSLTIFGKKIYTSRFKK